MPRAKKKGRRKPSSSQQPQSGEVYAPTPSEIREACEEIQASWSEREKRKRCWSDRPASWMPPVVQQDFGRGDAGRERSYQSLV